MDMISNIKDDEKNRTEWVFLIFLILISCQGQNHTKQLATDKSQIGHNFNTAVTTRIDTLIVDNAPNNITRTIIEDRMGTIWFATFNGIFKYDGDVFSNVSSTISKSRFFSVMEDKNGYLWFGSIGSGVYRYDGESFHNFTTNDGLINDEIVCIYEDKKGNIWFGANGGTSKYDGTSFHNYKIVGDTIIEDRSGSFIPSLQRPINEVNSIIEDHRGQLWFGTRGYTFLYDGKSFTIVKQSGKAFSNVRWIIEDKNEVIWLGGNDGLWNYNGATFHNITRNFVGYIYEDKKGNIWTSSQRIATDWALSRYDESSVSDGDRTVTEIKTGEGMFFGILEDSDGHIWSGTLNGVYQYDGHQLNYFQPSM